jgi:7-cyano-7-deazaguanine synthase
VPARNLVFLSVAAALAEAAAIDVLLTGFNSEEAQTFPDNSPDFLDAMNRALALATRTAVRVESPTLSMDKPAIAVEAHRLGIKPTDLWSCYGTGPQPCGVCESCLRSTRAWQTIT